MATRLFQLDRHLPGAAAFQATGAGASQLSRPEALEIAIIQPGPIERYLDPRNPDDAWTTAVYRFRPPDARREGNALWIDVDYGVTYHLRANQPYKLRIRQADGLEIEEVFTGPAAMRRPSSKPQGWTPPPDPRGPMTPPQGAAPVEAARHAAVAATGGPVVPASGAPVHAADAPASGGTSPGGPPQGGGGDGTSGDAPGIGSPDGGLGAGTSAGGLGIGTSEGGRDAGSAGGRLRKWAGVTVALLLAAGAAAWFLRPTAPASPAQPAVSAPHAPAPAASTATAPPAAASGGSESIETVRRFLASNPEPADARAKGEALARAGRLLDGQLLLFRYAGERGDRDSARVMGSFYDPDTWAKDRSPLPAPDPLGAARWYRQAAEAGDAEAQYRYAMLLKQGRTDEPDGPEQAVAWLRRAAEQGHTRARQALTR